MREADARPAAVELRGVAGPVVRAADVEAVGPRLGDEVGREAADEDREERDTNVDVLVKYEGLELVRGPAHGCPPSALRSRRFNRRPRIQSGMIQTTSSRYSGPTTQLRTKVCRKTPSVM